MEGTREEGEVKGKALMYQKRDQETIRGKWRYEKRWERWVDVVRRYEVADLKRCQETVHLKFGLLEKVWIPKLNIPICK